MNNENMKEEVMAAVDAAEGESSTPQEEVSSTPEVKETQDAEPTLEEKVDDMKEEVKAPQNEKDVSKMQEQIDNLNTALKQERGLSKEKIEALSSKLNESTSVLEKFKQVFVPPVEEKKEEKEPSYLTPDDVDRMVEEKFQAQKEEQEQYQKIEEYKKQITELETKWDGKDGKPKYDDDEVLKWQKENNKGYLTPEDAFFQMRRNEVLDYEVKQRMANAKSAVEVERTSSAGRDDAQPSKSNAEVDTRQAVLDAMENASKEM